MKHVLTYALLATLTLAPSAWAATASAPTDAKAAQVAPDKAQQIQVGVNGMVCDFCAQSLKKTFAKKANIRDVAISLEKKQITLNVPAGQAIDDATITKLITDAGYAVTAIQRM